MSDERTQPFGYCLNTSTVNGQGLALVEEIRITADAGYDAIEPWVRELDQYVADGGSLEDLGARIADAGLSVENLIGFFDWAVEDDERRRTAMEEARRCMDLARQVGAKRLAAPPMGVTDVEGLDLTRTAERYAELLQIGAEYGVTPVLEFWGFSKSLGRLADAVFVAMQTGRADACVLADVFHMYKGGSPFEGLRLIGPATLGLFHVNDYPADPPHATITDADRVYPGDGIAPLEGIFRDLHAAGYRGMLSLELFNEAYWRDNAAAVARTGLDAMREAVRRALAGA